MSNPKSKKKNIVAFLIIILLCIIALWVGFSVFATHGNSGKSSARQQMIKDSVTKEGDTLIKVSREFLNAISDENEDSVKVIRVSSPGDLNTPFTIDPNAGRSIKRIYTGRRINIAVIGVDSRLGSGCKHADANHVVSILIDKGIVEITSIPRDTPADVGLDDSTGQNKLTILYAVKGRKEYFTRIAEIAGLDRIHYYMEVGFSQAMGILELLGYKDAGSTLQVLRSRTALGGNDYQRSFNQGQFIRQMLLSQFEKLTGFWSDIFIRGGLALVNTNLNATTSQDIIERMEKAGFPRSPDDVTVRVRPPIKLDYKIYDFTDKHAVISLRNKIERFNENLAENSTSYTLNGKPNAAPRLWRAIRHSINDSARYPQRVINNLKTYFDQRAWLQVSNVNDRNRIRSEFCILLTNAYRKLKKGQEAERVQKIIDDEIKIFTCPELDAAKKDTVNHKKKISF